MKKIIDRPVLSTIFFIIVLILGTYSFKSSTIELIPSEELPSLNISYYWRGASPENILYRIVIPVEEEIMQIKGVSKLKSSADTGLANFEVEFERDVNMNFISVVLNERLNKLQEKLPIQVKKPIIKQRVPDDFKKLPFFEFGLSGKLSIITLSKIAEKEVLPYLKSIPGVESVEISGNIKPEIKIKTNLDRMKKYGISITYMHSVLIRNFFSMKSLILKKTGDEIILSLSKFAKSIEEVGKVIIKKIGKNNIFLKDIADIFIGYEDIKSETRYQGKTVIGFTIYKSRNVNSLLLSRLIRDKIQEISNRIGKGISFIIQRDESKVLKKNLDKIIQLGLIILFIILFILLLVFLDLRAALLVFSSVFFSVFTTFTMIYIFKLPLNILTLSGLALGFGLFVDNAVVVFDSILRQRERGEGLKESAINGAKSVILPVFSSTLTTIIVFFSFAFFEGRLRVYYLPLAYIIAISLFSSIIVSFTLIPTLTSKMKIRIRKEKRVFKRGKFYPMIIRNPLNILVPVVLLIIILFGIFNENVSFGRFFGWGGEQAIYVYLRFPVSAEFKDIKNTILKFENIALSKPYKKEITTKIYSFSRVARMNITFPPDIENSGLPFQLKEELIQLGSNLAGISISISGFDENSYYYSAETGSFLPYSIQIKGYNYEKLMEFANEVKKSILNHRRIQEVDIETFSDFRWGSTKEKYYIFKINREKLKKYGIINPNIVYYLLSSLITERSGRLKMKMGDREMYVEIKVTDVDEIELSDILNKSFVSLEGIPFRVRDVMDFKVSRTSGEISRENQEYIAFIKWDYLGSVKAGERFHKTLFKNLVVPPGFKKSEEHKRFMLTKKEKGQLNFAILVSLILVYLILGILYENLLQPILIMLAIPLAMVGVFIAYLLSDFNFDSSSYIGIILMSGIVVNNAILLIDNINLRFKQSGKLIESISIGAKERIRPIIITTLTTVFGMLPLVLSTEAGKSDIWSSLALCIVGGLTSSALLILFVLPILYYYFVIFYQYLINRFYQFIKK